MNLLISPHILEKSAQMAERDPHGLIITMLAICVIFVVLMALYLAYLLIGKLASRFDESKVPSNTDITPQQQDEDAHDQESYIITIGKHSASTAYVPIITHLNEDIETQSAIPLSATKSDKSLKSPLPGVITSIKVNAGDRVKVGQVLATLEAMKMENDLESEYDGIVRSVDVSLGESVLEGATIITIV